MPPGLAPAARRYHAGMYSQPRLARVEEAPRIHELLLAIGLCERVAKEAGVRWVRERCAEGEVWVIDHDEVIVSVMVLQKDAHIRYVITDERSRRAGLARRLLRHAKSLYPGLWAEARPDNAAANALLESEGFRHAYLPVVAPYIAFEWGSGRPKTRIGPDGRI